MLANANRKDAIAKARQLLAVAKQGPPPEPEVSAAEAVPRIWPTPCPCCGKRLFVIEVFGRWQMPWHGASPAATIIRIDTS